MVESKLARIHSDGSTKVLVAVQEAEREPGTPVLVHIKSSTGYKSDKNNIIE